MKQKQLYRTLETVASKKFANEKELLIEILEQIVSDINIDVTGGRLWKLDPAEKGYRLLHQTGNVPKINPDFILPLSENPIFEIISFDRTVLANETNKYLIKKGIFKYSASGVGSKIKIDGKRYYEYMLAVNSTEVDDDLRNNLNVIATLLTSKIRERRVADSREELMSDLDEAKKLQRSILPDHEHHFNNYDIFGITVPAKIMSGDYFDYLEYGSDEERLGVVVGDAASKGVSAAAEAMYISGAIRMAMNFEIKISALFSRLNQIINKIFSDDRFTTLFYGEITNNKNGLFLYANAGHNPPIFYSRKNDEVKYLGATGPLLGPAPKAKYRTDSINIEVCDILVIYSDGIVEAANVDFDFYEENKLESIIRQTKELSPKEIAYRILEDVSKFSENGKYNDDKTLVVIKRHK